MVSLHYTISKEDYVNFYTHVMWDAPERRKARTKSIFRQLLFVVAFMAVYYFAGGFRFLNRFSVIIIILMFGTSLLPLIGGRSSTEKQGEEFAENPENASVFSDNYVTVSDNGLEIKKNTADSKYTWEAIVRKSETPGYYFLFLNAIHAIIVPKRAFSSATEKNEFEQLLTKNLSLEAEMKDGLNAGE